ncbi:MAG: hypothetical protein GXX85_06850 [Ignavibacteria bacterium]|nr:hypothetical protein [Ignavibacteria bacterium]
MNQTLTYKKIFYFWLPLAATWLMMAVEGPFLSALIARMPDAKFNLAAYGVAFSLALVFESPVIMMMSASASLVKDYKSYLKLKKFNLYLCGILTAALIVFLVPAVFQFLVIKVISLPKNVAELTYHSLFFLIPWPAMIGYRRFYQGVMIRSNQTKKVAAGTLIRLFSMSAAGFLLYNFSGFTGSSVGAAALAIGVTSEAIVTKFMIIKTVKNLKNQNDLSENLSFKEILNFYFPLALTSFLSLGVQPILTFFISSSRMAVESLAVLPVINSLIFIFRSIGLSYQEVMITLIGEKKINYKILRDFAFYLAVFLVALSFSIGFTPLSSIWFIKISGLSIELADFALAPYKIIAFIPALTVLISVQRAVIMISKNTKPITGATLIEACGIILCIFIMVRIFDFSGAVAATTAIILGRFAANIYYIPFFNKTVQGFTNFNKIISR